MALLSRWIIKSYVSYYGPIIGLIFFLCLLIEIRVSDFLILLIIILAEGLIFNQILRIPGLACQFIVRTDDISFFWVYTNSILMIIFNTLVIVIGFFFNGFTLLSYGLIELNFYLIPLLALGNYISNSKVACAYTIFGIPILRLGIYFTSLLFLYVLYRLVFSSYLLLVTIGLFIIIYLWAIPKKDNIRFSYEFYDVDIDNYAYN